MVFVACGHAIAGVENSPEVTAWQLKPSQLSSQSIFKMHYEDSNGGATIRLVLRLANLSHFELVASDTFGRKFWTLELENGEVTVLDHKKHEYCSTAAANALTLLALEPLSIESLPLLLFGRLPVRPGEDFRLSKDEQTYYDAGGRKWSARGQGSDPVTWALWRGDRPELWWIRHGKSGILSRRHGTQVRWELASVEALALQLRGIPIPANFKRRTCDDTDLSQFRKDQSPSPSIGTQR